MNQWTLPVCMDFDKWLHERGGKIIYPLRELMNGYEINLVPPEGMTAREAIDKYDKEVLNA